MSLGQLVNGKWTTDWTERDENGNFQRMSTHFHDWVTVDGSSDFPAVAGRYHLYISLGCPWAHRTALLWKLKGLENIIGLSIVDPVISDQGWQFSDYPGCIRDTVNQAEYLWQVYVKSAPNYTGRVTVPVLWDKQTNQIVNNESRQIIQMFNSAFDDLGANSVDFYPLELKETIDRVIDQIYQPINNGVYRSGFAASQSAYEEAVMQLFQALETWDQLLSKQRYLCGDELTLADWCLFTTLFRFDSAYYGLFKCNLRRLVDFPHLWDYCRALYQYPRVSSVCNIDHVKRLYYAGLPELNPTRIVPLGPEADFRQPCSRWRVETSTHIMNIKG
ncbi:MAG TPA: glutathione S-transferase family protein [Vampirovibrionales bacterium]